MTAPRLSRPLANVFTSVLMVDGGHANDKLAVLQLLRHTNPDLPHIAALEARVHVRMRRYGAARQILEEADAKHPDNVLLKANLASTLFLQSDPLWEAYAIEARRLPPDKDAQMLLDAIDAALEPASDGPTESREPGNEPMFLGVRC
jgi:type III secretion protein HrpB1